MLEPDENRQGRRELAETLRELRTAAGLSGERLAVRAAMSQSKISRIESGKVLPTVIDVERILRALDVPANVANELLALARATNVDYTSWRSVARAGLWRKQAEIQALTRSSAEIRQFLPAIPSGLLQTADYARATLTPIIAGRPTRDVDRAVAARLESQRTLDDRSRRFFFLLTEDAVRRHRADLTVMTGQLRHMAKVAARPNVKMAIIPREAQIDASPLNIFVIYDDRLVVIELFSGEIVLRDPQDVSYHLNIFEHFHQYALSSSQTAELLNSIADEFMRVQDLS